ncbi:MAG: hypothetical protein CMN33_07105 [Saprospirales bacterium]|nr:hypothetical protein [Saprospirales bacterium]|tara:strand:- start:6186 stop:14714 length:8529 start_codon:yes stop_codon:yes gene_type:complete
MAKQDINIGVEGNDGTGDSIRESFRKSNENFTELYAVFGVGGQITFTTLSDTPDELTPNTIPLINDAGTLVQLVTLASNSALGGGATDTITFSYDTAGKLIISSSFTKMSDDLSPTLGGPLDAGGFGIANVGISSIEAERLNTTHDNLSGLTVDDLVITKGYADQRYITSGLPLRVAEEPSGKLQYTWNIAQYVDDSIEIVSHYNVSQALTSGGHGLESGANGTAVTFNAEDTDPNNLVTGTTYYLRVVSPTRLYLYSESNKQYATTDVQSDADSFKINPSGVIAADDTHTIVDAALDNTLSGNFLSDTGMPRTSTVRRQGDTMTGALYLNDHPGELAGEGAPNGVEDLQAASKYYVDNTAYSSPEALFVSTKGNDLMEGVPAGKEGTSLTYAFKTINAAAKRAEELIRSAPKEPGNYMQTLTHSTFSKDAVVINADVDVPVFEQARKLLDNNRDYIAAEVVGYINTTFPDFAYNSATCARDTGLIIDAIALDVNRGLTANYLTRQAAESYYSSVSARLAITTQLSQTVAGIVAARNIATALLTNDLFNQKTITDITVGAIPSVTTSTAHGLVDKNIVVFRDIQGMVEITNNTKKYVKVTGSQSFELYNDVNLITPYDTSTFTGFTAGILGQVYQIEEDQYLDLGSIFTITTAGNITVVQGETLTQAGSGATGIVVESVTTGSTVRLEQTTGTFNTGNEFTGSTSGGLGVDSVPSIIDNSFDADPNAVTAVQDKFNLVNTIIQGGLDAGGDIVYGSTYKIVVTNGAASYTDQTNPNNTDALPGKVIRGKRSEAIGQIVSFTNDVGAESANDPQTGSNEPGPTVFQVHLLGAKDFEPEEPLEYGNFVAKKQVTIMVETGIYEEDYPIRLSNNVSLKGDEFRRVIIKPKTETDSRIPRVSQSKWANLYFYRDNTFDGLTINNGGTEFFNQDGVSQGKFGYHYLSEGGKELNLGPTVTNVGSYTTASSIIKENKDYIVEETIRFISDRFPSLTYSEAKCRRDTKLIVDALIKDLRDGGEVMTLEVQGSYHSLLSNGDYLTQLGDSTQEIATEAAIDNISTLSNALLSGVAPNFTVVDAQFTPTNATYDPTTGILVATIGSHSLSAGQYIEIELNGFTFTCASDGNVTPVTFPRATDPAFQTKLEIISKTSNTITVNVGTSSETSAHTFVSAATNAITFGEYSAGAAAVIAAEPVDISLGAGESGTAAVVGQLIDKITFVFDPQYNPPKRNDAMDVFLMSDATIIRNVTVQGHGGFMCVLDPQGQVLTKSPYIQTASSFSKSINQKTFAGGMYVDAYVGNLPTRVIGQPETADRFKITVQSDLGEGLRLRPPELPCPFYVEGRRYQVNAISDYDQGQGTATLYLDANSNDGRGYDIEQFDDSSVERDIFLQTAGNRSMLANDFTQINDLGYGLIANNAAFSEQVSTFTYYCQTAMYANNGSEIRGLNCSNGYGNFGLIAEGADPNEIPDQVTLKKDMVQPAKAFTTGTYTNALDDPSITVTDLKTPPSANSLITIDHGGATGTLNYVVSTVTNLSDVDGDGVSGEAGDVIVTGVSALDNTTLAGTTAGTGTFAGIATNNSGSGTGLTVNVTITGIGVIGGSGAAVVAIATPGSGYTTTDTITISGSLLGGSSPTHDLTIDVDTIFGTVAGVHNNFVYKLDLKADDVSALDFFGTLKATVANNTIIEYRDSFNHIFENVGDPTGLVTRPSTAINFDESDNTTYRSIAFSNKDSFSQDLAADEILTTFEVGYDFVNLAVATTKLTGGYGSAQGDTKLAVTQLVASANNAFDDTERVTRDSSTTAGLYPGDVGYSASGGMRFLWDGKTHGVTNYTTVAEFTVTGSISVTAGETITQANTGATGVVHASATGTTIELENVSGSFNSTDSWTGTTSGALGANSVPVTINLNSWAYVTFVDIAATNINSGYGGSGLNSGIPVVDRIITAGLAVGATSEITVAISLMRATGHDFTQIGTGSFNDSNYPNVILGQPVNSLADFYTDSETASTAQVWERRKGRVFFVSTDQNGFFRVGKFFSVDQATGDITFAGEIGLSNANALGFKKGVTINEFSADDSFADDSGQAAPTEKAVGGYINRVLGFNVKSGAQITSAGNRIGTGFVPLNGLSPMEGNLNLNSNKIQNLGLPASGSDATNKNYVDDNANAFATVKQLRDTTVGTVGQNELAVFSGKQIIYTEPETGGTFAIGNTIQNDPATPSATGTIIEISTLTDEQFGSIRKIVYTIGTGTFDPDSDTIYNGVAQAVGLTTSLQADVGGPFPEITHASEATGSDINVTVTRTSAGTEYNLQYEADSLINADVSPTAAIAQSKLAMNTAGTRANASGIAQSDLGIATFKDTEFTHTSGFVELQTSSSISTGIDPVKLQWVATDTVLGRSAAGNGAVSAISFDTVLDEGGALRDSEFGAFGNSGDEVLVRTASATYSAIEVTTTGENSRIVKTQADGNIRAQGLILGGADTYEVATTTGTGTTLTLKTPGQAVILNAVGTDSDSLVTEFPGIIDVGSTGQTTESNFHTASSYTGEGFVSTDWLYTNFIEALTERDATSTGIGLGTGGGFTESAANTIVFVTNGTVEATINDSGIQVDDVTSLTTNGDLDLSGNGTGNVNITDSLDVDTITAYSGTNTNLTLAGKGSGVVNVNDSLTVVGTLVANGAVDLGDATSDTVTFTARVDSHIEPDATANNRNLGNSSRKWNTVYASVFDGTATSAQYADLAENYLADADYDEGTVLVFGGDDEVTLTDTKGNTRVAGVVSTNPAHLMNSNLEGEHVTAIALQGRVPCKVLGQVAKGDMLVTSAIPGYAIVNNSPGVGQVIGKAVGAKSDEGKGTVEVVVGRV